MSILTALRAWLKQNLRRGTPAPKGPIVSDAHAITLVDGKQPAWSIPWSSIQRINAFRYPGYIGDAMMIAIEAEPLDPRVLSEGLPGWKQLLSVLPEHLPGALKPEEWEVQLIALGPNGTMRVFERND